jgi:hypothetical protein
MSLTESELDRLADYTVDVLDPADAAEVSNLIETDPRWSAAYRSLVDADVAVRADLSAVGGTAEPMPADVVARIDTALAELPSRSNIISLDQARARRRRTMTRLAGAAAAVVAVVGGFSVVLGQLSGSTSLFSSTDSAAPAAERNGPAAGAPVAPPAMAEDGASPRVLRSGIDYRFDSMAQLSKTSADTAGDSAAQRSDAPGAAIASVPGPLDRLTGPAALRACLDAVLISHPGTVTVLDYARYLGEPSLVIVVRQATGSVVVAVGEKCGLNGADEKAAAPAQ